LGASQRWAVEELSQQPMDVPNVGIDVPYLTCISHISTAAQESQRKELQIWGGST